MIKSTGIAIVLVGLIVAFTAPVNAAVIAINQVDGNMQTLDETKTVDMGSMTCDRAMSQYQKYYGEVYPRSTLTFMGELNGMRFWLSKEKPSQDGGDLIGCLE